MNFSVQHAEGRRSCWFYAVAARIQEINVTQIMRISVISVTLTLTCLQLLQATPGSSQGVKDTKLTLELQNESLEEALKKIESLTDFRFVYRNDEIRLINNLKLSKAERTLSETLQLILDSTDFTYREMKKNILIIPKAESSTEKKKELAPEHRITGKVVDDQNQALAGVTVLLKGTT